MDATQAHRLIGTLADGMHPLTGERFAPDSPYQQAEIVRALYCALRALEANPTVSFDPPPAKEPPAKELPAAKAPAHERPAASPANAASKGNAGKPWSAEEERELLEQFDAGVLPGDIAKQHGRSIAGIEARLEKLGRLRPDQRTTTSRYPMSGSRTPSSTPSQ